jgi:hypothetical protein
LKLSLDHVGSPESDSIAPIELETWPTFEVGSSSGLFNIAVQEAGLVLGLNQSCMGEMT